MSYTPTLSGSQTITATFKGDSFHTGSSASTPLEVTDRSTSTSLSCGQTTVAVGQSTTCTATVTDTAPGTPITPAGSVRVVGSRNDGFTGSPCTLSGTGPSASCQITYTPTAVGTGQHTITGYYSGDGKHSKSQGQTTLTVTPASGT